MAGYRGHAIRDGKGRTEVKGGVEGDAGGLDELGFDPSPRLTYAELRGADLRAAKCLAEAHRELAASLPLDSRVRALALRCGDHWGRIAGLPHGLTGVPRG